MLKIEKIEVTMFRVRKILYATDFSSYSTQAYFHAVGLAESWKASLAIVTVFTPGSDGQTIADHGFWQKQLESIRPSNAKIPVTHVLLEGDPAAEIVAYAEDAKVDVIVMGTHGRSGVERLLMGSVAERVLRDAHCSVLVVKLPKGVAVAESKTVAYAG
jgi:nucleotide-binding universal stress UspA family protein